LEGEAHVYEDKEFHILDTNGKNMYKPAIVQICSLWVDEAGFAQQNTVFDQLSVEREDQRN
jgi:hypothetical protein